MQENVVGKKSGSMEQAWDLLLLFYFVSFAGWIFEMIVFWINSGYSCPAGVILADYRGVMNGPWVPIYGVGILLLVLLRHLFPKNNGSFYGASIMACAILEYGAAYILETVFHGKWWDYTGYFLNLNGRICFLSVFGFGIAGAAAIGYGFPLYSRVMKKIPSRAKQIGLAALTAVFLLDAGSVLAFSPNMGLGVISMG